MVVKRFQHGEGRASSDTADRLVAFLDEQLRSGHSHSIRDEYPSLYGSFPGGESFYIESQDRIASHAAFLMREFRNSEHRLKVGLVGSVTTGPDFRGQGMAKAVLAETVGELKRQGCVLAVLWSGQPDFYRLMGFHRMGREADLRFDPQAVPVVEEEEAPVEYDPGSHSHLIWRLYQKHDVRVDRSLEEQKALLKIPKARVFLTVREGKATSYLAIHKGADFTDYIHEWGGEPEEVRRNVAWVQRRVFPDRPLTLIAPHHYRTEALRPFAEKVWDGVLGLVKVLDRGRLLVHYREYLRELGAEAIWERNSLTLGGEKFDLSTDEGLLRAALGGEGAYAHPALPFFLWGFDSI